MSNDTIVGVAFFSLACATCVGVFLFANRIRGVGSISATTLRIVFGCGACFSALLVALMAIGAKAESLNRQRLEPDLKIAREAWNVTDAQIQRSCEEAAAYAKSKGVPGVTWRQVFDQTLRYDGATKPGETFDNAAFRISLRMVKEWENRDFILGAQAAIEQQRTDDAAKRRAGR